MKREDAYLQVLSEKTGEPPERLVLALAAVKDRLKDDLSDELQPEQAEHLLERLRQMRVQDLIGKTKVLAEYTPEGDD